MDQIAKRNAVRFGQMYLHSDSILTKCKPNFMFSGTVRFDNKKEEIRAKLREEKASHQK